MLILKVGAYPVHFFLNYDRRGKKKSLDEKKKKKFHFSATEKAPSKKGDMKSSSSEHKDRL